MNGLCMGRPQCCSSLPAHLCTRGADISRDHALPTNRVGFLSHDIGVVHHVLADSDAPMLLVNHRSMLEVALLEQQVAEMRALLSLPPQSRLVNGHVVSETGQ